MGIISDLHLGFRQYGLLERENDFYNQFLKICSEIKKHTPDIVIIAGDLFDKPNPSPSAINAYREGIKKLDSNICTIKGNHTMILRDEHYSIDDFFGNDEFNKYYYLDDLSIDIENEQEKVSIDGITYRNNSDRDELLMVQKEIASEKKDSDYRILIVHQSFKEFCGFVGEELSIEDIDYSPYDAVICGHIHSRFDAVLPDGTKFIQPGSIERMNTTEALDEQKNGKGFYILDTEENSLVFHKIEPQRLFFLGDVKIETKKDLENHLKELNKDIKKLKNQPIISYKYNNYGLNIEDIREEIGLTNKNILLNKSNIDDKIQKEIVLEIQDNEIPSVLEALKMSGDKSDLDDEECALTIDLYDSLNNNIENVGVLLSNFLEKRKKHEVIEDCLDDELEEFIEYFGED